MTDTQRFEARTGNPVPRVIVASVMSPVGATGSQTYVHEVCEYFARAHRPVTLVTPMSRAALIRAPVFAAGRVVEKFERSTGIAWSRSSQRRFLTHALRRELRRDENAVIYALCPLSARAALDARTDASQRVVMAVHYDGSRADELVEKGAISKNDRVDRSIRDLESSTVPLLDGIVYVSASVRRSMAVNIPASTRVPCTIVPNFTNIGGSPSSPLANPADLVTVGSLQTHKNQAYLFEVLAAANRMGRRYTLDVIGDGVTRRSLEERRHRLGLDDQVRMHGQLSSARSALGGHRAYVHASTRDGFPYALIEAMGAGLPIFTGATGGIPEMVDDGREAWFWPLDDADAAARVLIDVLDDERRRVASATAAAERFHRRLSADVVGPELERALLPELGGEGELGSGSLRSTDDLQRGGASIGDRDERDETYRLIDAEQAAYPEVLTQVVGHATADAAETEPPSSKPGRLKRLGGPGSGPRRAFVTTLDQGFASVSNFAVGIVVARIAGPSGLGAYAIAYTTSLVLATVHRGLVVEPMSIENDARRSDAPARIQAGLAAELILGIVAALALVVLCIPMMAFGQRDVAIALLTLAPFIPVLLVQDYWRWIAFMKARPGLALANDTLFNSVQAGLLILLILGGLHSPSVAIVAWGIGAAAGAAYGLRQFSASPTLRGGVAMVGSRWHMSKWLVASGIEGWGTTQAFPIFTGPFIGAAGLGGLKAAQSLVAGPANVLYSAGGSIGLPEAAHGLETGGLQKMLRVIRWVTIAGVISVGSLTLVIFVAGPQLLGWIYGPEFTQYGSTARIIALSFLIQGVTVGSYLTLKVTRRTRRFFNVGFISFVMSLATLMTFSYLWGVNGAAYAMLVTAVVTTVLLLRASRMTIRELLAQPEVRA